MTAAFPNDITFSSVRDYYGNRKVAGEVGLELEAEGAGLHMYILPDATPWKMVADNSLRGESVEFVLKKPIQRGQIPRALKELVDDLLEKRVAINNSYRTSTHVHVNAQELSFVKIVNWLVLYYIYEDILAEFCGRDRIGNVFCLRASDAEDIVDVLRLAITKGQWHAIANQDRYKYGAVNVAALGVYGSLEFRSMRGTMDVDVLNQWVSLLLELKDAAIEYDNPQNICVDFSRLGLRDFTATVFKEEKNLQLILNSPNLEERLYNGVRLAQELAYAVKSWDKPEKKVDAKIYGDEVRLGNVFDEAFRQAPPQPLEPQGRVRIQRPAQWIVNGNPADEGDL